MFSLQDRIQLSHIASCLCEGEKEGKEEELSVEQYQRLLLGLLTIARTRPKNLELVGLGDPVLVSGPASCSASAAATTGTGTGPSTSAGTGTGPSSSAGTSVDPSSSEGDQQEQQPSQGAPPPTPSLQIMTFIEAMCDLFWKFYSVRPESPAVTPVLSPGGWVCVVISRIN